MNKLKQRKIILAIAGIIVVLVIIGGGFMFLSSRNKPVDFSNPGGDISAPAVQTISAKDLGLVITVRPDNQAVKFKLNNAKDIKHVDYEIIYTHLLDGEQVQEGITGEMNIASDGITETDYRPFGTCSSGVCRYDKEVTGVKLVLKIEKKDGKVYSDEEKVIINSK